MLEPKTIKHDNEIYYHGNNMAGAMILFFCVGCFLGAATVSLYYNW